VPQKGKLSGQVRNSGVELCRAGHEQCSTATQHDRLKE